MDSEKKQYLSDLFRALGYNWKVWIFEDETNQQWIAVNNIITAISYIPQNLELPPEISALSDSIETSEMFSRICDLPYIDAGHIRVENLWLCGRILSKYIDAITREYTLDKSEVELVRGVAFNSGDVDELDEYPPTAIRASIAEIIVSDIQRFEQFISRAIATNSTVRIIRRVFCPDEVEDFINFYMREF